MKREEQIRAAAIQQCFGSSSTAERKRRKWIEGAMWADAHPKNHWKDAQGEDLPEYDREVIVLIQDCPDDPEYMKVFYGYRPNPNGYEIVNGKKFHHMTYGKGGWCWGNVKYWLDLELPINI